MGISGEHLAQARHRAGLTQQQLGNLVGVDGRTIRAWEASEVPRNKEDRVLGVDGLWSEPSPAPLASYSEMELLLELGRRFEDLKQRTHQTVPGEVSNPTNNQSSTTPSEFGPRTGRRGPRFPRGDTDAE